MLICQSDQSGPLYQPILETSSSASHIDLPGHVGHNCQTILLLNFYIKVCWPKFGESIQLYSQVRLLTPRRLALEVTVEATWALGVTPQRQYHQQQHQHQHQRNQHQHYITFSHRHWITSTSTSMTTTKTNHTQNKDNINNNNNNNININININNNNNNININNNNNNNNNNNHHQTAIQCVFSWIG